MSSQDSSTPSTAATSDAPRDLIPIVVAQGDGIGPEITKATLRILEAAGAPIEPHHIELGEAVYRRGTPSGVAPEAWDLLRKHRVLLKAPITTPQGGGFKSVNVTLRKSLGLFANVRPTRAYAPYVSTLHPDMDLVIIRENEEDLYAGIEHQQTREVTQVLKLITRPGTERLIRYGFEYAKAYGRSKVTCMTKDNIMKLTDGLFHKIFDQVASEYPDIEADHMIIDIGAARLAASPGSFDVIVTLNLYGDILSDISSQIGGSVGLAGSANIGDTIAMFEAVHGSAPDIAGQGIANPSGLLGGATQMLVYLGATDVAEKIMNAWLCTLEDGIHTGDLYREGVSKQRVGTQDFAQAVIDRLGQKPKELQSVAYREGALKVVASLPKASEKRLEGVDAFLDWDEADRNPDVLGKRLEALAGDAMKLEMITNRGVKVYPKGLPETFCTDHWRCRFSATGDSVTYADIVALLGRLNDDGCEVIKTENLYAFDGESSYSRGQGQ